MILLFEDNKDTPSSKLLINSLGGDSIKFSSGASRLSKDADQYLEQGFNVIMFPDVSLDNPKTVDNYYDLINKYIKNSNIIIVPIPCIEFFILKMLYKLQIDNNKFHSSKDKPYNNLIDVIRDAVIVYDYNKLRGINTFGITWAKSFETLCKSILGVLGGRTCLSNKIESGSNNYNGKFYLENCKCDVHKSSGCVHSNPIDLDIRKKAELLRSELPMFNIDDSTFINYLTYMQIAYHEKYLEDIYLKIQEYYDKKSIVIGKGRLDIQGWWIKSLSNQFSDGEKIYTGI